MAEIKKKPFGHALQSGMVTQVILTGGFVDKSLEIKYLSSFYLFSSEKANLPSYWKKGSSIRTGSLKSYNLQHL